MSSSVRVLENTYVDSVKLLAGTRAILATSGIEWGAVLTGTPANRELLIDAGFDPAELSGFGANDLVMAARGRAADEGFQAAEEAMFAGPSSASSFAGPVTRSLDEFADGRPRPNLAVISVAGPYAALEAHKALSAEMDVLLFSDNVPLEDEVALKDRAAALSRFVMGPGAGTALIDGVGLGFANAVRRGKIGVVAAAGTGAQEVMSLIHRAGLGVSQVIGVGGRDLGEAVGGRMTAQAIKALEADEATQVILLVSKPPSPEVAARILNRPGSKALVASLIGLDTPLDVAQHVMVTTDLESGVEAAVAAAGGRFEPASAELVESVDAVAPSIDDARSTIRGLFSGGTMCFEALTLLAEQGLSVHSNTPLRPELSLDEAGPDSHICLDLGEEEYTRGRPHPMIDPEARAELIVRESTFPETAVVVIDVVLGYGSHPDPAGQLAPACAEVTEITGGPQVIAYVLGTDEDPQRLTDQRRKLEEAGCIVAPTNARAALAAAAISLRRPEVAGFRRGT